MSFICDYSGKPRCDGCNGALYECDPGKNTDCTKTGCMFVGAEDCRYTRNKQFAVDGARPICARVLYRKERSENAGRGPDLRPLLKGIERHTSKLRDDVGELKWHVLALASKRGPHYLWWAQFITWGLLVGIFACLCILTCR